MGCKVKQLFWFLQANLLKSGIEFDTNTNFKPNFVYMRYLFYGCDNYPKCNYALWDKPTGEVCPNCGGLKVEKKNKVYCPECDK